MSQLPEVLETIVVGPEDRLVIVFPAGTSMAEFANAREVVEAQGWNGRVLFVAGAEQLAVLRGPTSPNPEGTGRE